MTLVKFYPFYLGLFLSAQAFGQIPPLSQEIREEISSSIVSGSLMSIKKEVVALGGVFSDTVFTAIMRIDEVSKSSRGLKRNDYITFTYKRINTRPADWCCSIGQAKLPQVGSSITAYLDMDDQGKFSLLEPNGFDVLTP
jgi:hypothetical protein